MSKKDTCIGILGWLFGHKIKDIYEEQEPKFDALQFKVPYFEVKNIIDATKQKVYVQSFCKRCGKVVERRQKSKYEMMNQ